MIELLEFAFFQRALIGGFFIGLMCPLIGLFLVLRRLSLIGDTLAHVSIAGVAFGFLINIYPSWTGLGFAVIAAFAIEFLRKTYKSYAELSIAIIMSGGIALASILFTIGRGYSMNVQSYLFGSIYTLNTADLVLVAGVSIVVLAIVSLFYKPLFLMAFDEDAAAVSGMPMRALNIMITILTAIVISSAIKFVGALLVSALLTIPSAIGMMLNKGFRLTLIYTVIISEAAVLGGILMSGQWDTAPGGTIVLLLIGVLLVLLTGRKIRNH